jgi:hypothetical protein
VVEASERGLAFLAGIQRPDGSFPGQYPNAGAALASMAFMACGHFPARGRYGANLERAVQWLVEQPDPRGYFGRDGSRMYGHGMCALALAESYGMLRSRSANQKVRNVLDRAVQLIVSCQTKGGTNDGGWRYEPEPGDADLSVTAWQVQALRGAQNGQIPVPQETVSRAVEYVRRCYHRREKGFAYQPGMPPEMPMMCAGIVVMNTLKEGEQDIVRDASEKLLARRFGVWGAQHFYYQSYYMATAGLMLGPEGHERICQTLEKMFVERQNADGSWPQAPGMSSAAREAGPVYTTSLACLVLAARFQYLPIYQK